MAVDTASLGALDQLRRAIATRDRFFFWMSVVLLGILVVGFAPTLYLRVFFDPAPIPAYLHVHGAIITAWFVWLVMQTALVRSGNTPAHRRMGEGGAIIACAVVIVGPMATIGSVPRIRAAGYDWYTDMSSMSELGVEGVTMLDFMSQVVWANFISIAAFAGLVTAAIILRRKPQYHKRLMLFASIAIVGPALARVSRIPVLGGEDGPFITLALFGLVAAMVVHDMRTQRSIHVGTIIGFAVIVLGSLLTQLIARSQLGLALVQALA